MRFSSGSSKARIGLHIERPEPEPGARPLRVLLLSDGRPGHFRQSEGVVAALRRRGPLALDRQELRPRWPMPKALIPKLGRLSSPAAFLRLVHGVDPARLARPDIIVSAGGSTLGANVALAQLWGVPNVFSGSTRGYPLAAFRLVLTPYASVAEPPKVVFGPKPSPFDPDRIPAPRPLRAASDMRGARVAVLIGGPTPYAAFDDADWSRLAALVEALVDQWQCRVTVVTSPRTPEAAYTHVEPLAARSGGAVSIVDFRAAGPGSIDTALDCEIVLVTSDSMSMMTEAAVSRRPAVALAPRNVQPNKDDQAVAGLVAAGWLAVLPLATADAAAVSEAALALKPMQENHLDRLADLVHAAMRADAQAEP
jgi:mitochondrial fission protein ELM1